MSDSFVYRILRQTMAPGAIVLRQFLITVTTIIIAVSTQKINGNRTASVLINRETPDLLRDDAKWTENHDIVAGNSCDGLILTTVNSINMQSCMMINDY